MDTAAVGGIFDISNLDRLGQSEVGDPVENLGGGLFIMYQVTMESGLRGEGQQERGEKRR